MWGGGGDLTKLATSLSLMVRLCISNLVFFFFFFFFFSVRPSMCTAFVLLNYGFFFFVFFFTVSFSLILENQICSKQ